MKNGFNQFSDIEIFLFGNGGKLYTDLRLKDEFPSIMRLKILSI